MSPVDAATKATDEAEAQAARAMEHLVGTEGFGGMLGQVAENTAAIGRLGSDAMDLVLPNLRVAGRRDVLRLSRQLSRTQDQLERVLQEVEALRAEQSSPRAVARAVAPAPANGPVAGIATPGKKPAAKKPAVTKPANGKPVAP